MVRTCKFALFVIYLFLFLSLIIYANAFCGKISLKISLLIKSSFFILFDVVILVSPHV